MTERLQFRAALDFLYGMSLPQAQGHRTSNEILSDLFETLNGSLARGDDTGLDAEHMRWLWEWARDQWESQTGNGAAPPLEPW